MTLSRISNTSIVKSVNGDPINSEDEFEVFKTSMTLASAQQVSVASPVVCTIGDSGKVLKKIIDFIC